MMKSAWRMSDYLNREKIISGTTERDAQAHPGRFPYRGKRDR